MKKRRNHLLKHGRVALSVLLSICMILGLFPVTSFANSTYNPGEGEERNLVLDTGVTAVASYERDTGYASLAIDGRTTGNDSRWKSDRVTGGGPTQKEWIYIDLGEVRAISKVILYWEGACAKEYQIQVSNQAPDVNGESNWVTVHSITDGKAETRTIDINGDARYIRMNGLVPATNYGYSLYEFEVYGRDVEETNPPVIGKTLNVNGKIGDDSTGDGTLEKPYKSINKAAQMAHAGDTIVVAAGLYREQVKPLNSGTDNNRITYTTAGDGDVVIKGSEQITDWIPYNGDVWSATLPNSFFGDYNPYNQVQWQGGGGNFGFYNAGDVYLNEEAYYQKGSMSTIVNTPGTWYSISDSSTTTIYANFGGVNPNNALAEINVRRQVFAPDVWGLAYITVDGFTIMHAANWYSDFPDQPERAQRGAISVYGGKNWIIQNNRVINARTIGIDIGLGCDMWGGNRPPNPSKPDGVLKTHFTNTDKYGSHIVRNNYIAKCGQSGVAGVFSYNSKILYNHIEDNNYRGEFSGAETAPIKLHYNNYGLIQGNYIRNSKGGNSAGIWTDWGCQGIRVTGNIVMFTPWGYYAEAVHGPILVDNNIFIGNGNLRTLDASGVVFANNLFVNNGSVSIDGKGRNNYWFEPGTMTVGAEVKQPKQDFWWHNNLSTGTNMPSTRVDSDGYTWTHNKENESSAISNFQYNADSSGVTVSFDLNNNGLSLIPVTPQSIGKITFPGTTTGEFIQGSVNADYFGNDYTSGSQVAGPFADVKNGSNTYTLWPIVGQETPEPPPQNPNVPINLSLNPNARAYSSYSRDTYTSDKLIDGNGSTRWGSDRGSSSSQDWVYVDLGKSYNISKVVLQWEAAYGKEYEIQISDDAGGGNPTASGGTGATVWNENKEHADSMKWETVYITKEGSGGNETIAINREARSIRMKGIKPSGLYGFSIYEFEVHGTESVPEEPVNIALGKQITAYKASSESVIDGANPSNDRTAYRAFDGETSTRWGANENTDNWIQVDLGKQHIIDRVVLDWESSYAKQYKIQVADSTEGPWEDIYSESNGNRPTFIENNHFVEEITLDSEVTARVVRMQGIEKATQYGYSLWEFNVYGKEAPADSGPQWPTGSKITFSNVSSTGLTLTWPAATDVKGIAGYKIFKGTELITNVSSGVNTYNMTGLEEGKNYVFKVEPYNTAGTNGPVLSVSTTSLSTNSKVGVSNTYPTQYSRWMDALPAGNGKMGIMVFGNPLDETVIFNDKDFFTARSEARPYRTYNDVSEEDLKYIRDKLIAGDYTAANTKANQVHGWNGGGEGNKHPGYKMTISMPSKGVIQNYSRATDYSNGLVTVNWSDDAGDWERTSFVSRADDVTVQYLSAPQGEFFSANFALGIDEGMHLNNYTFSYNTSKDYLNIRVKYPSGSYDAGYEGVTRIITDGTKTVTGNSVSVANASYVMLLSRTQRYDGTFVQDGVAAEKAEAVWNREEIKTALGEIAEDYTTLLNRHTAIHSEIFNRVAIDFNASIDDRAKTNEQLLASQKTSSVMLPALYERLYYSGRYLMLAASGEYYAPDLLGNWTGDSNVGWGGSFHLDANLNLQISGGNIGNMPEAMQGYFWLVQQWKEDFKINAEKLLGTRGMLTGGNTPNQEGLISSLNFDYPYQYVTGGVSWLLYPLWEYYLTSGDEAFLEETYYPLVREMGDFYEDFLVEKDLNGKYIFAGSISPETRPTGNGSVPLAINSVYDISGARFALETLIESSDVLNKSTEPIEVWQEILDNLPEYIINKDGALSEWAWPGLADKIDYQHRHASGLMPIWPYREVTAENNKEIYDATREFSKRKAQGSYENAGHGLLHAALIAANNNSTDVVRSNLMRMAKDNYYYNSLATAHYNTINPGVYCTDIAISLPTILMEMLATTDRGRIELLPALPEDLPSGSIDGMLGRGQFKIDQLKWDMDKHEIDVTLTSDIDQTLSLIQRSGIESIEVTLGYASIAASQYGNIARNVTLKAGESSTLHIKMKDASKVNLALNKTAIASSKSNDQQGPEKAFDGISDNSDNRWGGNSKNPEWLQVDLGDVYALNEVVIDWEASYAKDYKIQVSMNSTYWTDALTKTGLNQSGPISHSINALGRYVRMYSENGTGPAGWGLSIYEMEVYGQLPTNIAQNKQASAGSTTSQTSQKPSSAFDGDMGTRWGGDSKNPEWLAVDLGDVYDLYKVAINWEASYAQNYLIEVSMDGKEWTKAAERSDFTGGRDTFLFDNVKGRYIRMFTSKGTGPAGWGLSIYEFEVYGVPAPVDTQRPTWPDGANLTAQDATDSQVMLSWHAAIDDTAVTAYEVFKGTEKIAEVAGNETSYEVTGLTAETVYEFSVQAMDAAGNKSADVLKASVTTLPVLGDTIAPTWPEASDVTGSAIGLGSITLTWTPAQDDTAVEGYDIYVGVDKVAEVAGDILNYQLTGLTPGTEYVFTIQARDAEGNTSTDGPSVVISTLTQGELEDITAPVWPEGSVVTTSAIGINGLTLTWTTAQDDTAVIGYEIYNGTELRAQVEGTSYTVNGLRAGTQYTFTIKAKDAAGNCTVDGLTVTTATLPEEPGGDTQVPVWPEASSLVASNVGTGGLTLTWTAAQDDTGVTGYIIYIGNNILATVDGTVLSYNISGLSSNTQYTFTVKAVDVANNMSGNGLVKTVITASSSNGNNNNNSNTGSTTPVQTTQPNTVGNDGKVTAVPEVKYGKAVVKLSESDISKAAEKVVEDSFGVKVIQIEVKKVDGVNAYVQELPASMLSAVGKKQKFQITTDIGTVVVPGNMLAASDIAGAGNAVITIEAVDRIGDRPALEIIIKLNDTSKEWNNADAAMKVSIPYTPTAAELADPEHIVAGFLDESGKFVPIPNGKYDAATGTVNFITTESGTFGISYVNKTFGDLVKYSWAQKPIEVLASKGVINGVSTDRYQPEAAIKRADFLVLLVKALGLSAKAEENFDDVKEGVYYADALAVAKKLGITSGVGNNKFNPNEKITRQDMMILIDRAMRVAQKTLDKGTDADISKFTDKDYVSAYAKDSVATLIKNGIVTGSESSINPKGTATRAETAVMIYKIYNK